MRINEGLLRRYKKVAPFWNSDKYKDIRRDDLIPEIIRLLEIEGLKEGELVLEAMCGTGMVGVKIERELAKLQKRNPVLFLDFSPEMLNQISSKSKKLVSDIRNMPFPNNYFSRVVIRNALHDVEQFSQLTALQEIYRILRKDGVFVLMGYYTTPENQSDYNYVVNLKDELSNNAGNYERYFPTMEEYQNLLGLAGFKNIAVNLKFTGKITYENTSEILKGNLKEWKRIITELAERGSNIHCEFNDKIKLTFLGAIFSTIK